MQSTPVARGRWLENDPSCLSGAGYKVNLTEESGLCINKFADFFIGGKGAHTPYASCQGWPMRHLKLLEPVGDLLLYNLLCVLFDNSLPALCGPQMM